MSNLEDAKKRSAVIAERIRQRTDVALRRRIAEYQGALNYSPLDGLAISRDAWRHVASSGFDPKLVFAHPELLGERPAASQYYRGIALLPQKRVSELAGSVVSWESGASARRPSQAKCLGVARLYNTVISSIIEGSTGWTLENGYRNIVANMGIGLDGTVRNLIGQDAEQMVKARITDWLDRQGLIRRRIRGENAYELPDGYIMRYGSEPDIEFRHSTGQREAVVATIEIKGGKDPAGALERLGAIQKSFEATPPNCKNILIAGVVTSEMAVRLRRMGIGGAFLLDDVVRDGGAWVAFLNEVFHYTIRITPARIAAP